MCVDEYPPLTETKVRHILLGTTDRKEIGGYLDEIRAVAREFGWRTDCTFTTFPVDEQALIMLTMRIIFGKAHGWSHYLTKLMVMAACANKKRNDDYAPKRRAKNQERKNSAKRIKMESAKDESDDDHKDSSDEDGSSDETSSDSKRKSLSKKTEDDAMKLIMADTMDEGLDFSEATAERPAKERQTTTDIPDSNAREPLPSMAVQPSALGLYTNTLPEIPATITFSCDFSGDGYHGNSTNNKAVVQSNPLSTEASNDASLLVIDPEILKAPVGAPLNCSTAGPGGITEFNVEQVSAMQEHTTKPSQDSPAIGKKGLFDYLWGFVLLSPNIRIGNGSRSKGSLKCQVEGHEGYILLPRSSYCTIDNLKEALFNHVHGDLAFDESTISQTIVSFRALTGYGSKFEFEAIDSDDVLTDCVEMGLTQGLMIRIELVSFFLHS